MLTSINLENWRSHESTTLEFRKGTNLLVGIMGSGKSSVLDAISFALFGTFPALEHRKLSFGEIMRHERDFARVKLRLEWKGEKYEVMREIKKTKNKIASDAELRKGSEGKLVEKGQTAVTRYVEHILQIDYDLFSRAIYSEQNNIDHFLTLDPAKRKVEMDELLGLIRFEAARSNAVTLINKTRNFRLALEARFSRDKLEEIRVKEKEAAGKCARYEQKRKSLSGALEKTRALCCTADSMFLELKAKKKKMDAHRQDMARAKGAIEQLKEELSGKDWEKISERFVDDARKKKADAEKALATEKKAFEGFEAGQNLLSKEAGALESRLETAANAKSELENAEKELGRLLAGKKPEEAAAEMHGAECEALKQAALCQSLSSEIKKLEEASRNLSPDLSKCPLCRTGLTREGIVHVLAEYKDEIKRKKSEMEAALLLKEEKSAYCAQLGKKMRAAETIVQRQRLLGENAAQYREISKSLALLRVQLSKTQEALDAERQRVEKSADAYQQAAAECREAEELLLRKNKLVQMETLLGKCESELAALGFSEVEFENARKEVEEKRLELERLSSQADAMVSQLKSEAELLALVSSERAEMEALEKEIGALLKLEEELSIYKNALLETQSGLRREVIEAINTTMSSIWPIVYPYEDYKGLRLAADGKGYEFEIYDSMWRSAELVSGGERACLALTFRISLATVLTPNMSMLVLDEPTHNLDKEAVTVLAHVLQNNLPELIEQSFVITHEEGLMGSEFAGAYKMSRDKDANAPTSIEEI